MPTTTRIASVLKVVTALTLAAESVAAQSSVAPYTSTLTYGTGLVTIPVAWVSPESGDLYVSVSARAIGEGTYQIKSTGSLWDLTPSIEAHLGGRLSLGASLYSTKNQEVGGFGQLLLVKQPESGSRWLPSLAVGFRNLGSSKYQDRYVTGDQRVLDAVPAAQRNGRGVIDGSPTIYGVATREFVFGNSSASLTAGFGNGLFANDGGLDTIYNKSGTLVKGGFLGARLATPVGEKGHLNFMLENNGWDWNLGAALTLGHLTVGLYMTELEEEKGTPDNRLLANYTKTALAFSYNASIPGIVDGSTQRAEYAEARLALRRLEQEVAQRKAMTTKLIAELQRVGNALDKSSSTERDSLLKQLEAERAALKAAQERLDALSKKPPEGERR